MTAKQQVLDWWNAGCDYNTGVGLYLQLGKNRVLKTTLPGRAARYTDKLKYELCKAAGLDWTKMPRIRKGKPLVKPEVTKPSVPVESPPPSVADAQNFPPLVRRVIYEYAECYRKRGALHFKMSNVPETNDKASCQEREVLLSEIKKLSARMDVLYLARQAYLEKKQLPDPDRLWPKPAAVGDNLPDDVQELKKLKKQIQTSLTKDRNLLDYGSKTKLESRDPMPAGPKRLKVEKRMKEKRHMLELIEIKIINLS